MTHHFGYKQSINNCANCSYGDTVADLGMAYAATLFSSHQEQAATQVLNDILTKRENDISPWKVVEVRMQRIGSQVPGKFKLS